MRLLQMSKHPRASYVLPSFSLRKNRIDGTFFEQI